MIQSVWWLNHGKSTWFTLSKTNEDEEIDEKKRHPRLFSGRVLINDDKCSNIYVSLQMWVFTYETRELCLWFSSFLWPPVLHFATCSPRSTIVVSHLGKLHMLLAKSLKDPFFVLVLHTNRPQGDFCYTICDGSWGGAGNICVFILYIIIINSKTM